MRPRVRIQDQGYAFNEYPFGASPLSGDGPILLDITVPVMHVMRAEWRASLLCVALYGPGQAVGLLN